MKIIEKDLTRKATIRTKSHAKYYINIINFNDLHYAVNYANENNLELKIIGKGTNILFSKPIYENILFIELAGEFNFLNIEEGFVEIGAAYSFIKAGKFLIKNGYEDFIFFTLIPGSLGGAIRQNAGTREEGEIKDLCISAKLYDIENKKIIELLHNDLLFEYRNSIIQKEKNKYIVLSAKFELKNKIYCNEDIIKKMKDLKNAKREREPKGYSFGSTFKNNKLSAWQYIDSIYNDIKVNEKVSFSKQHKNWIINKNASGEEIKELIEKVQAMVYYKHNIMLEKEVEII